MSLSLPNPSVPANGQAIDATPLFQNQAAIVSAIQSFDASQIQAGTLTASAFSSSINPNTILHDTISPFVQSGCVWSAVSGLTGTMTGGVVYVGPSGSIQRVTVSGVGSNTFTASQDTYIDIDYNGNIYYQAVSNGGTAPSLTANSVRIAKIITGSSSITSVVQTSTDGIGNQIYPPGPIGDTNLQRNVAAGYGTQPTGNGALVISGLGFTPRVIQFTVDNVQGFSSTHGFGYGNGWYDRIANTQSSTALAMQAGIGGGGLSTHDSSHCITSINAVGSTLWQGAVTATSNDGFTLTISSFASTSDWWYTAWA